MPAEWTIQEAGTRLGDVIEAASMGQPQYIYKDGQKEAVLVSNETWEDLNAAKPSFKELLMSIPKGEPFIDEDSRSELKLRDMEF